MKAFNVHHMWKYFVFMFFPFLLMLSGCAVLTPPMVSDGELKQAYQRAVADAEIAEANEISTRLTAINRYESSLQWDGGAGRSRVLMVTWTHYAGYDGQEGEIITLQREVWVTPVPALKDFCRSFSANDAELILRLEQLLGLPPHNGKDRFVELWVAPADLFRPAPDPEITDQEAELEFPASSRFVQVNEAHREWFERLKSSSYGTNGYPWTRLGYTYDWGNSKDEVGLSEFVIRQDAEVRVHAVNSLKDYCR